MEIIRISDSKMKLSLDGEDMKKYGISVEELSRDTTARRRILWTLLDEAKRETGLDAAGKKTVVEAFPGRRGGCEVFVSIEPGKREVHTLSYRFADMRAARTAATAVGELIGEKEESTLYVLGSGEVVLTLSVTKSGETRGANSYSFLEEYGKKEKNPYFPAYAREYGACLYERDAILHLCEEKENFSV